MVRRFDGLCRFLADNRDKFETVGFSDLDAGEGVSLRDEQPLSSSALRTAWRYGEQLAMRLW